MCLVSIPIDEIGNWLLLALRPALIEEGFKRGFVVKGHRAETGSFKEEVKFHVFFCLSVICGIFIKMCGA